MTQGVEGPLLRDLTRDYMAEVTEFLSPYEAAREATLVIEHLTGFTRTQQSTRGGEAFDGPVERFQEIVTARRARQPLAQILGTARFRDRPFRVTPDVLCPRADTETLIDLALATPFETFLDLGTGPGTIALTLLAECPGTTGVATDISEAALRVARQNAEDLGVASRVRFHQSDWVADVTGRFDLIVSNPPYIDAETYGSLPPEITTWEPKIALTPGGDGLAAYRVLAQAAPRHLAPGGRLLVEIGHDQGGPVSALFRAAGLEDVAIHSDLSRKDRVVLGNARPHAP